MGLLVSIFRFIAPGAVEAQARVIRDERRDRMREEARMRDDDRVDRNLEEWVDRAGSRERSEERGGGVQTKFTTPAGAEGAMGLGGGDETVQKEVVFEDGVCDNPPPVIIKGAGRREQKGARVQPQRERLPDTFNGTRSELRDFIIHFETVSRYNGWNDLEKGQNLAMSLRGAAQQVLSELTPAERNDFVSIVMALRRRFDPGQRENLKRTEFRARLKRKEESVGEYGFALGRLAAAAYPGMSLEARETLIIDQFVSGLPNKEVKKHIHFNHPETIHDAIALACEYESFDGSIGSKKPENLGVNSIESGSNLDKIENLLKTLIEKVESKNVSRQTQDARFAHPNLPSGSQKMSLYSLRTSDNNTLESSPRESGRFSNR